MSLKPMYEYIVLLLPWVSLCGLVVFYLLLYVQPIHYLALQLYFRTVNYISDHMCYRRFWIKYNQMYIFAELQG